MNKNIIFLVLLIFLNQCGYSPIYKGSMESDINIRIINMEGNKEFNNKINFQQLFSILKLTNELTNKLTDVN